MRVDFYQLGDQSAEAVLATLAGKVLESGGRMLVVAADEGALARLDRGLWDQGATSFLPHGIAGSGDDSAQPILLSTGCDAPNLARNLAIADGEWRDAALSYERAFFLFGSDTLEAARLAWKLLSGREGIERHYWASEDGRWTRKA